LIQIHFKYREDRQEVFRMLNEKLSAELDCVHLSLVSNQILQVTAPNLDHLIRSFLVPVLRDFIVIKKEGKWIRKIIGDLFYFKDEEEQQQIATIVRSLIDGDIQNIPNIPDGEWKMNTLIEESLTNFLSCDLSFSFESFLQFRLKNYRNRLLTYVEAAIDEYKLEQEYQNFIESLRRYITERNPIFSEIYLVHDDTFQFYTDQYKRLTSGQLYSFVEEDICLQENIDIESLVIAPLISMAPQHIYLFTDDMDHGMVQTIQNVFQERVTIQPSSAFRLLTTNFIK
jgi:putative sporulation protein YtxC